MTINQSKSSGTETQHWAINSLSPVTGYFCKCLIRFSSGLAEGSHLSVEPKMERSFSMKPRQYLLFLYLRTQLSQVLSLVFCDVKCAQLLLTHPLQDFQGQRVTRHGNTECADLWLEKCHLLIPTATSAYWFLIPDEKTQLIPSAVAIKQGFSTCIKKTAPRLQRMTSFPCVLLGLIHTEFLTIGQSIIKRQDEGFTV